MNILMFGAGSTGRGHLATLLFENGYRDITFVDKDHGLVQLLKDKNYYSVHLLGDRERTLEVKGFNVLDRMEEDEIIEAFIATDIVITAVIADNLQNVSEIVAKAITQRKRAGKSTFLNIIACENLDSASSLLKKYTYERLSDEEQIYSNEAIGFPDAMISRVVPLAKENPLYITAEDYNEWVVCKKDFKGSDPEMPFMNLVDNLEARLERKLWIHNGGHATVAYAGFLKGCRYIHEAVADVEIGIFAGKVLDEIGDVIQHKYEFSKEDIDKYKYDLVVRGSIQEMKDDISRVVRDPIRKLGIKDRLLAPALYAEKYGLSNSNLLKSILNIISYYSSTDDESVKMHEIISDRGLEYFLSETVGLKISPELIKKLIKLKERNIG